MNDALLEDGSIGLAPKVQIHFWVRYWSLAKKLLLWALVLVVWEVAYQFGLLNPMVFGSPLLVVKAAISNGPEFLQALRTTAFEIFVAIVIAWTVGISFGALAGSVEIVARISSPILAAMIALPFVILYPILMIWFGIGPASKIAFGVLLGVFPIALNTMVGVSSIESGYFRMARSVGASRAQTVAQVTIPLALPAVLAGLRLGTSQIVIGVILTEMLASTDGVGYLISYHRSLFNTGHVLLGIIIGLVLAAIANAVLTSIEHRYGGWRAAQQDLA